MQEQQQVTTLVEERMAEENAATEDVRRLRAESLRGGGEEGDGDGGRQPPQPRQRPRPT